jgi:P pilus assembly chaperone PapD
MKTVNISKSQNQIRISGSKNLITIRNTTNRFYRHTRINAGVYASYGNAASVAKTQSRRLKT